MKRLLFAILAGVFLQLGAVAGSQAAWLQEVTIVGYGQYSAQTASELSQEGTEGKISLLSDLKLEEKTTRIPSEVGNRFGLEIELKGSPLGEKIPLQVVVKHPPITNPKTGETTSSLSWKVYPRLGDIIYAGWEFIAEYECVPGEWTIRLQHDTRHVAEQQFSVYIPDEQTISRSEPEIEPEPEVSSKQIYLVQTGVFSNPEYAHDHMQKLKTLGFAPCILTKPRADTELYFIFVAAESTQQQARESARKFKAQTDMEVYVNTVETAYFQKHKICPEQ